MLTASSGLIIGSANVVFSDQVAVARVGDVGVILLLFFLGMEVSLEELVRRWRVAIVGTALQVAGSVAVAWAVGQWLGWPIPRIVLIGFVIISIGLLVDLHFVAEHWVAIGLLVVGALVTNTVLNMLVFEALGRPWSTGTAWPSRPSLRPCC